MSQLSNTLRDAADAGSKYLLFRCPGCNTAHTVKIEGPGSWGWNGDITKPTFTPSVLVTYDGADAGQDGAPPKTCHSFVTDGRIQYLSDCTHALAGQTVDLPEWGAS